MLGRKRALAVTPEAILRRAVARNEMKQLLLGFPAYRYRTRWSPAPGNTDLTDLLGAIYELPDGETRLRAARQLLQSLSAIVGTYEGLDPVATCILLETTRKYDGRPSLNLPIATLANELRLSIRVFALRLRSDKTGLGQGWPEGRLDDFRRLSKIVASYGGPAFYE